ncbi:MULTISPECIES: Rieske (2Fe-2S) protein [unclassified Pseudomonas]|jgi:nitrite reductase/ring-hydroxylating ferredoxin subunit|uniref:Rieske (2Fe-2S) protein n=1 Tax=Pseudomonas sp. A-R-26 TaxID=2832404 RepID=UPI001CC0E48E
MAKSDRRRLCHLEQIAPGQSLGFRTESIDHDDIFLVNECGNIFGYKNSCPHWPGSTMPVRKNRYLDSESRHIVCSGHGALFEINSGLCIKGPCLGLRLTPVSLEISEAGEIFFLGE